MFCIIQFCQTEFTFKQDRSHANAPNMQCVYVMYFKTAALHAYMHTIHKVPIESLNFVVVFWALLSMFSVHISALYEYAFPIDSSELLRHENV